MSWGVDQLEVQFGSRPALSGVSVELAEGEVTAVVGGDGAGKTTLMRALVGVVRPTAGRVRRPARSEIGFVPATAGSYGDLTVMENLSFVGEAFGVRGRDFEQRVEQLLALTELVRAKDRLASRLSGGMRRKLALALALLHHPLLLALDEPTTGVDPFSRAELWKLIGSAAAAGAAVLVSTTYVDEAQRAAAVTVLEQGRVLASGSPETVIAAMPGHLGTADTRPAATVRSWRRGRGFRVWTRSGSLPPGSTAIEPDLEDAVMIAALQAEDETFG